MDPSITGTTLRGQGGVSLGFGHSGNESPKAKRVKLQRSINFTQTLLYLKLAVSKDSDMLAFHTCIASHYTLFAATQLDRECWGLWSHDRLLISSQILHRDDWIPLVYQLLIFLSSTIISECRGAVFQFLGCVLPDLIQLHLTSAPVEN